MDSFYVVSVFLHVLAATAWIGAMIFFAAVVVPALRDPSVGPGAPPLLRVVGNRYRVFGWVSLGVLIVTGITNLWARGIGWATLASGEFWSAGFGRTLAYKLVFVALVTASTILHDVWMGARATKTILEQPTSPEAKRLRVRASYLGRATLLLSLAVLWFAVRLVRGM